MRNKFNDMVYKSYCPTPGQLEMALGRIANPSSLDDNNSTTSLQKSGIWFYWFVSEETSCMNSPINFLDVGDSNLCTEVNSCSIVVINVIKITVDNDYTHILHVMLKWYIYGFVISKSTVPEAEIQSVIWKTICLPTESKFYHHTTYQSPIQDIK